MASSLGVAIEVVASGLAAVWIVAARFAADHFQA